MRVEITAVRLRLLGDVANAALRRSLEEHVLERVSEPTLRISLVEVTSLHVGDNRDDRRRVVLLNQNGETVGEDGAVDTAWVHWREAGCGMRDAGGGRREARGGKFWFYWYVNIR